ncbi:MAG TPA: hypothetical protein VHU44_18600 [Acidobacteriaceae bacterium]|jgi:hypothetical protein|nr:hypothetical protein [Acidobacteriaceae bacterium]
MSHLRLRAIVLTVCAASISAFLAVRISPAQERLPNDLNLSIEPAGFSTSAFPDAPQPSPGSAVDSEAAAPGPARSQRETDLACQSGTLHGKVCRAHWLPILWQSFEITAAENLGNIGFDSETRHDLVTNPYWSTYVKCVKQFRYDQWRDDDSFMVDYVAHGLQGAIASDIFEQNSPTGRGLVYMNNGNYWRSRLKGMAWSAVYEVQWKIGPASEASIGNSGLNTYFTPRVKGRSTNETGFQDFVDTPVVGFGWNVGEDALDRFLMPKIWSRTHNKWVLAAASVMTPSKAAANLLRYKPPYYRDFPITPLH